MIIPYRVTTFTMRSPWANLALIASNVLMFVLTVGGALSDDLLQHDNPTVLDLFSRARE